MVERERFPFWETPSRGGFYFQVHSFFKGAWDYRDFFSSTSSSPDRLGNIPESRLAKQAKEIVVEWRKNSTSGYYLASEGGKAKTGFFFYLNMKKRNKGSLATKKKTSCVHTPPFPKCIFSFNKNQRIELGSFFLSQSMSAFKKILHPPPEKQNLGMKRRESRFPPPSSSPPNLSHFPVKFRGGKRNLFG